VSWETEKDILDLVGTVAKVMVRVRVRVNVTMLSSSIPVKISIHLLSYLSINYRSK
jgi:hypothetical protein